MENINEIKEYLIRSHVKPSYPRLRIMRYLVRRRNHPTVDMIYNELVQEIPTLSRTTVYNALNVFVEKKMVIPIHIEDNEIRYDATVETHGHFKCVECGVVYDFSLNDIDYVSEDLKGFRIDSKNVYFRGICLKCLNHTNRL